MIDFLRRLTMNAGERQQEMLHAYLDGELSARERSRFEQRLEQDAELRRIVEQSRLLKQQLRQLPSRPVPRSFVLDPVKYGRPAKQPLVQLYPAMRFATVLTAFFFMVAVATNLFVSTGGMSSESALDQEVAAVAVEEAPAEAEAAAPMMVEETAVEVTRVVQEVVTEMEEIVEEESAEAADDADTAETTVEEPAAELEEPTGFAQTEGAIPPAAEGAAAAPAAPEAEVAESEVSGAQAELMPTPAPTSAAERAGTAGAGLPTATASAPPRPLTDGTTEFRGEDEISSSDQTKAAVQPTAEAAAANQTIQTAEPESAPLSTPNRSLLSGLQVGLGILLAVLAAATLWLRRRQ